MNKLLSLGSKEEMYQLKEIYVLLLKYSQSLNKKQYLKKFNLFLIQIQQFYKQK